MTLVRSLTALSLAAVLVFTGLSSEAAQKQKPKKGKTAHGTVLSLQAPGPGNQPGFLVLQVKATKKQGGGVGPAKFAITAETVIVKHGPKKGGMVPGLWLDVVPGAKVRLLLHPADARLAVSVTITSTPKKKKGQVG